MKTHVELYIPEYPENGEAEEEEEKQKMNVFAAVFSWVILNLCYHSLSYHRSL